MFGYLKYEYKGKQSETKNIYKCYYCGLCCALKKNYGLFSTIFLSNDVVFLNLILSCDSQHIKYLKPQCCFWKRCSKISLQYQTPYWKKVAAFMLALVYVKAYDDVLDNKSILAKIRHGAVKVITKRAYEENLAMFEYMKDAMTALSEAEQNEAGIVEQSEIFSSIVLSTITNFVEEGLSPASLSLISSIMKWLCFIDAVDDYESDVKKKVYNPFNWISGTNTNSALTKWNDFFSENWREALSIYSDIFVQLHNSMQNLQNSKAVEAEIIRQMVYENMPKRLINVMKGNNK